MVNNKAGNITFQTGVSGEYRQKVIAAYATIPPTERLYLENQGVTIHVGVKPQDLEESTKLRKSFRGNSGDKRTNVNHCSAWYNPATETVYISEFILTSDGKTWQKSDAGYDISTTLRHELGHAFEWHVCDGIYSTSSLPSASPRFKKAYQNDISAFGGIKKLIKAGFGYYVPKDGKLQSAAAGGNRCELFAELYAGIIGSAHRKEMSDVFPETYKVMTAFLERHQNARAYGPEAAKAFCRDFMRSPATTADKRPIRKTATRKLEILWHGIARLWIK